jgi:hypothetical protein
MATLVKWNISMWLEAAKVRKADRKCWWLVIDILLTKLHGRKWSGVDC